MHSKMFMSIETVTLLRRLKSSPSYVARSSYWLGRYLPVLMFAALFSVNAEAQSQKNDILGFPVGMTFAALKAKVISQGMSCKGDIIESHDYIVCRFNDPQPNGWIQFRLSRHLQPRVVVKIERYFFTRALYEDIIDSIKSQYLPQQQLGPDIYALRGNLQLELASAAMDRPRDARSYNLRITDPSLIARDEQERINNIRKTNPPPKF